MTRQKIIDEILKKQSYLCVGLDTDITKIPRHLLSESDPVFAFNKAIIESTRDYCVSYKINTAFYEAMGVKGWESLEKTVRYIGEDHFTIADAKRGDIGNTSDQYARAFFETIPFDAVTVAPYMGADSVEPFLKYPGKFAILLGLTSNKGAGDFQLAMIADPGFPQPGSANDNSPGNQNHPVNLFEFVLKKASNWGSTDNLMFVIGAPQAGWFERVRAIIPDHFLLVPGVGTQGGNLKDISEKAMNKDIGILVNVSRAIIYASGGEDFAEAARLTAQQYQSEMSAFLSARVAT
jgi:orotidine-5'-phosphate decarboxylase